MTYEGISPKLLAAITTAVQAYLDGEAYAPANRSTPRLNAWRMSARRDTVGAGSRDWTGRGKRLNYL